MILRHGGYEISCCVDCRLSSCSCPNADLERYEEGPSLHKAYPLAHFAASLRQTKPMTIGLRPPVFLDRAMRVPPNISSPSSRGHSPRSSTFMKSVVTWSSVPADSL